jgi:hypothetical protein
MKLRTHSLLILAIVFSVFMAFSFSAWGTDVGGIIDTDTIWTYEASHHTLASNTQVTEEEFPWVIFYPAFAFRKDLTTSITYNVYIEPEAIGIVEAYLEGINRNSILFSIDTKWTDNDKNIIENISNIEALDTDSNLLPINRVDDGWIVSTSGVNNLKLKYNFGTSLKRRQDMISDWVQYWIKVTENGAFLFNSTIFAYPKLELDEIKVVFNIPNGWVIGTSFLPENGNNYKVEGIPSLREDLLYNVTRLGISNRVISKKFMNLEIIFIDFDRPGRFWYSHYGNTIEEQMHEYLDLTWENIKHFKDIFGMWAGGSRYWISTPAIDELEVFTAWSRWFQAWPRERYQQVPHHVLHAWIWSSPPGTFELKEAPERLWVAEGIPTYYEAHSPLSLTGNKNFRGITYVNYLIFKRAVQFELLNVESIKTYAYQEMRTLALDREIRKATIGNKSLDDLLAVLNQRHGKERQGFTREQLIQAINDVAGIDLTDYYMDYMAGDIGIKLPDVNDYMSEYENEFLEWIDWYVSPNGFGKEAKGSRTMFFIALEMAIQEKGGREHYLATGGLLPGLQEFKTKIEGNSPLTREKVISVLSSITGVSEDDFFDFYTVGNYSPSVDEITIWLNG